ncbi:hypothetical protein WR25_06972 [Diploscapter pachys]|uniref:Uncharacterized protein n=1 Tax=Diploscapter pachys TaxID=2018661 RepID=A0A2A2K3M1_9BILA|nr:hypothetical protein WR25_06972 [Diploscapter pachys]
MSISFVESRADRSVLGGAAGAGDSLEAAAHRVAQHLESVVEQADIYGRLTQNGTTPCSGLGDTFFSKGAPEFFVNRRIPIPGELIRDLRNVQSQFSMGLFMEISRAYMVVDNEVFLWNFDTGDDLAYFDQIQSAVVKLALVRMKPGIFPENVKYGLVFGTVTDIILYPLIYETTANGSTTVSVMNKYFQVQLDTNTTITDIVGIDNGRVFYSANHEIFEFVYENSQSFLFGNSLKCKSVNKTSGMLSKIIPFFGNTNEELEHIAVDKSRNILYCLGRKGTIQVYDLGADGDQCTLSHSLTAGQIANESQLLTNYGYEDELFTKIITICPLEAHQSNNLNLIAVTAKGVRIYFSVLKRPLAYTGQPVRNSADGQYLTQVAYKSISKADVRPQTLRVAHIRFAPGVVPSSIYKDTPQGVSIAYADEGRLCLIVVISLFFAGLCAMSTAHRKIIWALSDLFYPNLAIYVESMTDLSIDGHVWAIAPHRRKRVSTLPPDIGFISPVLPHSFYRLPIESDHRLIICSSEAVYEIGQVTPLDALRDALQEGGTEGRATFEICQKIGFTEILVLGLGILVSDAPTDDSLKPKAEALFHAGFFPSGKDSAQFVETSQQQHEQQEHLQMQPSSSSYPVDHWSPNDSVINWKGKMRSPLYASTPRPDMISPPTNTHSPFSPALNGSLALSEAISPGLSSVRPVSTLSAPFPSHLQHVPSRRHDALYYYFSRLVSPIWNHSICSVVNSNILKTVLPSKEMHWLASELRKLGKVMDECRLVPAPDSSYQKTQAAKLQAEASNLERQSLLSLRRLIDLSSETLYLWSMADEFDLAMISAGMEAKLLATLASRRFHEFVSSNLNLNCELIRALIKFFLGDDAGTKFIQDDACVTNAMEQLNAAASLGAGAERKALIDRAVGMFTQSIAKVALHGVAENLTALKAYDQLVELCLLKAQKEDTRQLALIAYRQNGRTLNEDREMMDAERRRNECYRVITEALDELENNSAGNTPKSAEAAATRDKVIARVLTSSDELAQAAVFKWMIDRSKANLILQSKSPYIEQFLQHEIDGGRGQRFQDLLWKFYEKSGNYGKAADKLSTLVNDQNSDIGLEQRISYLSHAIICARSAADDKTKESIDSLRDLLDVAQIQLSIRDTLLANLDLHSRANSELAEHVKSLNRGILTLNELFINYAVPCKLFKVQLAIFQCANMYNEDKIAAVWESILKEEFQKSVDPSDSLLHILTQLYEIYRDTVFFPKGYLVRRILQLADGLGNSPRLSPHFYLHLCSKLEIELPDFLALLNDEYRNGDPWWSEQDSGRLYISQVALTTALSLIAEFDKLPMSVRGSIARDSTSALAPFVVLTRDVSASSRLQEIGTRLSSIVYRNEGSRDKNAEKMTELIELVVDCLKEWISERRPGVCPLQRQKRKRTGKEDAAKGGGTAARGARGRGSCSAPSRLTEIQTYQLCRSTEVHKKEFS